VNHSIVVATSNRGKLEEFRALLAGLPVTVHTIDEACAKAPKIVEDGATFTDNALIKVRAVAAASMMLTLADDSGLEVDALDGAPGPRSARYAHIRATDAENNAALLTALAKLPDAMATRPLTARFRCVLALLDPYAADAEPIGAARQGSPIVVEGRCEGVITRTPRGSGGFGYDPLFVVEGRERTMAELTEAEKNELSHRARAFAALRPVLERVLAQRDEAISRVQRG
jgi:XTP/dITP diphosphohydrolase